MQPCLGLQQQSSVWQAQYLNEGTEKSTSCFEDTVHKPRQIRQMVQTQTSVWRTVTSRKGGKKNGREIKGQGGRKGEPRRKKIQTIQKNPTCKKFCIQTHFSYKTEKLGYIF